MKSKLSCGFCGKTNTKIEDKYVSTGLFGLGSKKVGSVEKIDDNAEDFYRCAGCGVILCNTCMSRLDVFKKEIKVFSTKRWTECPKCGSKVVKIN